MRHTRIPVTVAWIADEKGGGGIEIVMSLDSFESSGTSIRSDIREFKRMYRSAVEKAKEADAKSSAPGQRKVSTKQRWIACKVLADFNRSTANKFEVINRNEAYSRDFGLPSRSTRSYLDFGNYFAEAEVLDQIPYSLYAELAFKVRELKSRNIFDSEKRRLVEMGRAGNLPSRDEYRKHLRELTGSAT